MEWPYSSAIDSRQDRIDYTLSHYDIDMLFQNYLDGVILFQLQETEKNISKVIYMNVWARKIFDSFSELGDKINQKVFKPIFND